jgi:hypothetical protein
LGLTIFGRPVGQLDSEGEGTVTPRNVGSRLTANTVSQRTILESSSIHSHAFINFKHNFLVILFFTVRGGGVDRVRVQTEGTASGWGKFTWNTPSPQKKGLLGNVLLLIHLLYALSYI